MGDTSITIGNYHVLSAIASGSFGRVYLARHTVLTTRLAALKLMHEVPFSSEQERGQFLQEAQVLELLKHPYILPVLDAGIDDMVGSPHEWSGAFDLLTGQPEQHLYAYPYTQKWGHTQLVCRGRCDTIQLFLYFTPIAPIDDM